MSFSGITNRETLFVKDGHSEHKLYNITIKIFIYTWHAVTMYNEKNKGVTRGLQNSKFLIDAFVI